MNVKSQVALSVDICWTLFKCYNKKQMKTQCPYVAASLIPENEALNKKIYDEKWFFFLQVSNTSHAALSQNYLCDPET